MFGHTSGTDGPGGRTTRTTAALRVADALYEAALDPARWPAALATLAGELGAAASLLRRGSGHRGRGGVLDTFGFEPAAALACGTVEVGSDPLCAAAERHAGEPVMTGVEVAVEAVAASEFGRLVLERAGLAHALGAAYRAAPDIFFSLWFFRPPGTPFGPADAQTLAAWLPHVARAVAIQGRLAVAEQARAVSSAAFDLLAVGAVMVDEGAHPITINRLAERILAGGDGLRVERGMLCAECPEATARLHAAIRDTAHEAAVAGRTRSTGLRVARKARERPLDAIVVSLARQSGSTEVAGAAAIVFISDPERTPITPERLLRDLYGLTPAETRLALSLSHGRSLTAAAAHVGVTRNTAHTQLAAIFGKTGTATQTELVRLLHRGPAAIRPYEDSSELLAPVDPKSIRRRRRWPRRGPWLGSRGRREGP